MGSQVATYPTGSQKDRWKDRAAEMGMSLSEFVEAMTESGMKKFDVGVEWDETADELREQRNDLRDQLARERNRIEQLERQLYGGEREVILQYIAEHGPVHRDKITAEVVNTANIRTNNLLSDFEAEGTIRYTESGYVPEEIPDEVLRE